jgi:hypothetical protein
MDARAAIRDGRLPTSTLIIFAVALVAAVLLGGTGGYLIRGLSFTAATGNHSVVTPFVVQSPPYSAPKVSPAATPVLDPNGHVIPI